MKQPKKRGNKTQTKGVRSNKKLVEVKTPTVAVVNDEDADAVNAIIGVSYINTIKELQKADILYDKLCIDKLRSILSEFVTPYLLIGYMPNGEPVEIFSANDKKDFEALVERSRKTLIKYANAQVM